MQHPEGVQILHAAYLFVGRTIMKDGASLAEADHTTINDNEDRLALMLVTESGPLNDFEPHALFLPMSLKCSEDRVRSNRSNSCSSVFRNISALVDCVGWEKFRLWGKL